MAKQTEVIKGMIEKAKELDIAEAAMFRADLRTKVYHVAGKHCKKHFEGKEFTALQRGDTLFLLRIK